MDNILLLDKLPFDRRSVTMLFGDYGSGKTSFCYEVMNKVKGKQLYIDGEGGFSDGRMKTFCGADFKKIESPSEIVYTKVGHSISIRFFDTWDEISSFFKLQVKLNEQYDLVVLEGLPIGYKIEIIKADRTKMAAGRPDASKEFAQMLVFMKVLVRDKNGVVIFTNWRARPFSKDEPAEFKFLMSETAGLMPKNIYELNRIDDAGLRMVRVEKAKNLPEGLTINYRLTEKGIEKVET